MTRDPNLFNLPAIPDYMIPGLSDYLEHGILPGDFLTGILEGDLFKAAAHADSNNLPAIPTYARWLFEHAPASAYGSPKAVAAWVAAKAKERGER